MNQVTISEVMQELAKSFSVTWEYPGHIAVITHNNLQVNFGEGEEGGYSWATADCTEDGEIEDLDTAEKVAAEFAAAIEKL